MATATSVVSLLLLKGQFGQLYKSAFVDLIEIICYANLFVFSIVRLKFETDEIVDITTIVSGIITMLLLMVIVLYHMYNTVCMKYMKQCRQQSERQLDDSVFPNDTTIDTSLSPQSYDCSKPTFSVVELKLPASEKQVLSTTNKTGDDNAH